jgi:hypothetical protein
MPVKRRKSKERRFQIGDDVVDLFIKAREFQARNGGAKNEDGWHRRFWEQPFYDEYRTVWLALHRALHLAPYHASPLDVESDDVYGTCGKGSCYAQSIPNSMELRDELIKAASRPATRKFFDCF